MRVLVACEFSGVVRSAFARRGHDAWSCDLEPSEDGGPHIQGDALAVLGDGGGWNLLIAHPPCTYLAVSGARWWPGRRSEQKEALAFARAFLDCEVPMVCVENPVGLISTAVRRPDQIIQPYEFGHPESKKTCLWLKGLPLLRPTQVLGRPAAWRVCDCCSDRWCSIHKCHTHEPRCRCPYVDEWPSGVSPYAPGTGRWENQTPSGQNKLGPGAGRARERARTYAGVAAAMAEQWG